MKRGKVISAAELDGFQHPPGSDIGGDTQAPHHPAAELPIVTEGAADASHFQPPRGQMAGDDLPMKFPEDFGGATENVMGAGKLADIRSEEGFVPMNDNPSLESLNPTKVDAAEKPLPAGFLGRSGGWER